MITNYSFYSNHIVASSVSPVQLTDNAVTSYAYDTANLRYSSNFTAVPPQQNTLLIFLTEDKVHQFTLTVLIDKPNDGSGGNLSLAMSFTGLADSLTLVQGK